MAVAELPEELITNILVRLPVKSLGRFRCVCKPWRSFIIDPSFIRKHVDRVSTGNECESTAILLICTDAFVCSETPSIKSTEIIVEEGQGGGGGSNHQDGRISNPTVELLIKTIDLPEEFRSCNLRIKSSCDGILCMASSDFLLLWNPSIKEYKTFPLSGERVCNFFDVYGIGYDRYLNDYKVLRVPSSRFGRVSGISDSLVEILMLKSMSWKTIQNNFHYDIVYYSQSTLVYGALHWVATNIDTGEKVILYFDVMKEKFGELPLPSSKEKFPGGSTSYLRQFGGNLCFMVQFSQGRGRLDIWVMKKYGVQESWTKLLTFRPLEGPGGASEPIHPYCSTPNGILLFNELRGEFVLYNTRDKTFTTLCDNGCIKPFTRNIAYVKSLVSPIK